MWAKVKINRSFTKNTIPSFDEGDLFWRKWFWESLINLIDNSDNESLVISIDAPWWEWKTRFLQQWKIFLEEKNRKIIYFDSFKSDYIEDPFTALLGEVMKIYQEEKWSYEIIKEKWINVAKSILPLAWKIWARILLGWDIKNIEDKLEEIMEWEIIEWIHKSLQDYVKQEDTINAFKKSLEDGIKKSWEIIFIIDELDRCRPDFALRLLERMKHFFDVPGVYFVLGINKVQLIAYVEKIYGEIDANKYLQKFLDIETVLPKNKRWQDNVSKQYLKYLKKEYRDIFIEKNVGEDHHILRVFTLIVETNNFSLRDIEKAFNYLILSQKSLGVGNEYISWELLAILSCLKMIDLSYIKRIDSRKLSKEEIINALNLNTISSDTYRDYLDNLLSFLFDEEISDEVAKVILKNKRFWNDDFDDRYKLLLDHVEIMDMFNIW